MNTVPFYNGTFGDPFASVENFSELGKIAVWDDTFYINGAPKEKISGD